MVNDTPPTQKNELIKALTNSTIKLEGRTVAACNDPDTTMSAEQVEKMRRTQIDRPTFGDCMTLLMERYDREMSSPLIKFNYQLLSENMGHAEFMAAFLDLGKTECAWHNVVPYLIQHAERQRDEGPDLFELSTTSALDRARESLGLENL
jgi:hypothetical protein